MMQSRLFSYCFSSSIGYSFCRTKSTCIPLGLSRKQQAAPKRLQYIKTSLIRNLRFLAAVVYVCRTIWAPHKSGRRNASSSQQSPSDRIFLWICPKTTILIVTAAAVDAATEAVEAVAAAGRKPIHLSFPLAVSLLLEYWTYVCVRNSDNFVVRKAPLGKVRDLLQRGMIAKRRRRIVTMGASIMSSSSIIKAVVLLLFFVVTFCHCRLVLRYCS